MGKKLIVVDRKGKGDYYYIQDALDAVRKDNTGIMILVKEGVYYEKIIVDKPHITLVGELGKNVTLVYDDHLTEAEDATNRLSATTATIRISATDFSAENIIFANSASGAENVEQAVTMYIEADRAQFHHCGFLGRRDTLVTAPTPLHIIDKENEGRPVHLSRQYFRCCYFEGDSNFLAGSSTAIFEYCKIHSLNHLGTGYITTASTPMGHYFGYVFKNCLLTGDAPKHSTYLGRPWKNCPKVAFIQCTLGEHIHPQGWEDASMCCDFVESGNVGAGADLLARSPWSRTLTTEEASRYTLEYIFTDASWCIGTVEYQNKKGSLAS